MIKLKYGEIKTHAFSMAFQKLTNQPTDGYSAYKIKKLLQALTDQEKIIHEAFIKEVMEVYATRDAEGKYDPKTFTPDETKREAFDAARDTFGEKEFTILRPKLTLQDIKDFKLTANEQLALGDMLDDSDAEKQQQAPSMMRVK